VTSTALDERPDRDRCPGVLALHEAADGWLARVRLPGGRLSAAQLKILAAAAEELGSGLIDLTVRANLQLRGLDEASGYALAERLRPAGLLPSLAHDRVRNILAGPLCGRLQGALDDVDEIVALLDARVCGTRALGELPGRFCFLVDDGTGAGSEVGADITVAARGAGRFSVLLDGQLIASEGDADQAVTLAIEAAQAFLELRGGDRNWRLSEISGGAAGVARQLDLRLASRHVAPYVPPLVPGIQIQRDGRAAVTALPPLAQLCPAVLRELAELCRSVGSDVRLSTRRTVTIVDVPEEAAAATSVAMGRAGLEVDGASGWIGLTACAGVRGCPNALADVRAAAAQRADVRGPGAPAEHWAACGRRCGEGRATVVAVAVEGPGNVEVRRAKHTVTAPTLEAACLGLLEEPGR